MTGSRAVEATRLATIEALIDDQAKRTPSSIAVVCGHDELSYKDLRLRSVRLAQHLATMGVGAESLVGVYCGRSVEMLVAMLGVLYSGGAYVPLDPAYPSQRLEYIVNDSGLKVLLTQQRLVPSLPPLPGVRIVCVDEEWLESTTNTHHDDGAWTDGDNLAYVIYTSGSTGQPKGVGITRNNAAAFSQWARSVFEEDLTGVLASTSICFDLSVFELFVPLQAGGTVFLVNNALDLNAVRNRNRLTLLNTVPSVMAELLRQRLLPASVRTIALAGEVLHRQLAQQIYKHGNITRLFNLYGPTESTTYSTYICLEENDDDLVVPIGKAIDNTQVYVLDGEYGQVTPGATGELYISGDGLARGYIHRAALTAERFLPNPFSHRAGGRMYRTGDRVTQRHDGHLEFVGRVDDQVKVRGFRIELGEIESALIRHPDICEAAVVVHEHATASARLIAYVCFVEGRSRATSELRRDLAKTLPDYMLPAQIVVLATLPRLPNGKVAKRDLPPPPQIKPDLRPQTKMEEALAEYCSEILELTNVSLNASFLELGGSSLNASRLAAALRERFQFDPPIRELLRSNSLREAATVLERLRTSSSRPLAIAGPSFRPAGSDDPLPASFSQERVWFVQKIDKSNLAYAFTAQITLRGDLNLDALEGALNTIVQRHEIFRTTLREIDGSLFQVIHEPWRVALECQDLRGQSGSSRNLLEQDSRKAFDLQSLPLVRWSLVRLEDHTYVFQSVEHHIVHDGWSYNVFLKELTELYRARTEGGLAGIHPHPLQFRDFALWQRKWIDSSEAHEQEQYWAHTLAGVTPLLSLPYDRPRPEVQTSKGDCIRTALSDDLYLGLLSAARGSEATPFMLCLAAFQILLYRYSGQDDFCIGTGIANRQWAETTNLIGMLVNNLALRVHTDAQATVAEVIVNIRDTALAAYANQDLPFDRVVQVVDPARTLSYNPLFQVMFSFHDSPVACATLSRLTMEIEQALSNGSAKFDMNIVLIPPQNHNLSPGHRAHAMMLWEYNSDLFDAQTVHAMVAHYLRILETVLKHPETRIGDFPLLSDAESTRLLAEWNSGLRAQERPEVVPSLFEHQAAERPDAVALLFKDKALTYQELNRRANRLAHHVHKRLPGNESPIGICLERSTDAVVAFLAVLKSGNTYVPLDPSFPADRLEFMLLDAGVQMVITQESLAARIPQISIPLVCLDQLAEALGEEPESNLGLAISPEHLAYVMYTSGSTGGPKGTGIPHRAIVGLLCGVNYVQLGRDQTLLQLAPLGFDASTFEIWGALLHGGRLVLYPERDINLRLLEQVLNQNAVSCLWLTASLFNWVIDSQPGLLRKVSQVLTGGEALSVSHVERAVLHLPETTLINGYGPTEATTFSCTFPIPRPMPQEWKSIPIGHPINNAEVFILDAYGWPAPTGVTGELHIGGSGLARGYLNRPDLTAENFVPNPFGSTGGDRLYRTGDLVKWRRDRSIEFIGRRDLQVKIRGHRIEPGEIERTLETHPYVRQAAVLVREETSGERLLVAYIVVHPEIQTDAEELRTFVERKLPEFMIPGWFVQIEKLPLRVNGKVDTAALPDFDYAVQTSRYVEPRTATERKLAALWTEMLPGARIGANSHFFQLGGHSLKGLQLIARVRDAMGVELTVRDIFEKPRLRALADRIDRASDRQEQLMEIPRLLPHPRHEALPLSFNEEVLWSAAQVMPHFLAFNTQLGARLLGEIDLRALQQSLEEIVQRHEALRTTFPERDGRPYRAIARASTPHISTFDLTEFSESIRERKAWEVAVEDVKSPFNLAEGPLQRITLIRLAEQENILLITAHHISTDGWSLGILSQELRVLYSAYSQGQSHRLRPILIQGADYAAWQRSWLKGELLQRSLAYWTDRLRAVPPQRGLPPDLPEISTAEIRQDVVLATLNQSVSVGLRQLSERDGVTLFMSLLAVYQLLLSRWSGTVDVAVSVPISQRSHRELESVMGLLINLVTIHTDFRADPSFAELLRQVRATTEDAYANCDVPLSWVAASLGKRQLTRTMFDFINVPDFDITLPGLKAQPFSAKGINPFNLDMILFVRDKGGEIHISVMYNMNLFSRARMVNFMKQFEYLAKQIVQSPDKKVSEYLLSPSPG